MKRFLYKRLLRPILFSMDPDKVHKVFVKLGETLGNYAAGRFLIRMLYGNPVKEGVIEVDGIVYRSPVGLAAGFDYNGRLTTILPSLSFGSVEVGSVTARPCGGNEPPRLRRMVRSKSLVVYKGLKNEGVEAIIERLKSKSRIPGFVIGVSVAKTNDELSAGLEEGIADYCYSLKRLVEENIGDFYTINISCPNVHGGEDFAESSRLQSLFEGIDKIAYEKPLYVKMPINLPESEYLKLLEVLDRFRVNGLVIGNLNKNYEEAPLPEELPGRYRGGLSGSLCRERSTNLIRLSREKWGDRFTIIGCGGVLSAKDAEEKFAAGADLIQLITGMIFEGPHLIQDINKLRN